MLNWITMVRQFLMWHTLLCFGCFYAKALPTAKCPSARIEDELAQLHYDQIALDVACLSPGVTRDLFEGVLDNRMNRVPESLRLLRPLASNNQLTRSQTAVVLSVLADDNAKIFEYSKASYYYDRLLLRYSDQLNQDELSGDRSDASILKLLRNEPKQTIDIGGIVDLPARRDPHGVYRVALTAHDVTRDWIIDTGADHSVISESFAKELGLKLSNQTATTPGFNGLANTIHVATLDRLRIGNAVLSNMVVLVLPDANLSVSTKNGTYIIPALLGYPALQAFGRVRLTADHHFRAGPTLAESGESSSMYMDHANVLLLGTVHNQQHLFQLDTGANETVLYSTYYRDFPEDFVGPLRAGTFQGSAVGGTVAAPVDYLDKAELTIAGQVAAIPHVPVQLNASKDPSSRYEGNLGCDLFGSFHSVTFDFANSRLYLGTPTAQEPS